MEEQKEIEKNNMPQQPPWTINNITCCYEGEHAPRNIGKRQHFLQHKTKHQKEKEVYTDGSKNPGKKVGLAAVFEDMTKRGALLEEASVHTAEMKAIKTALKETKKKEGNNWVIYTDSKNNIQAIESNKENHPILNQIHDILADLKGQKNTLPFVKSQSIQE